MWDQKKKIASLGPTSPLVPIPQISSYLNFHAYLQEEMIFLISNLFVPMPTFGNCYGESVAQKILIINAI